MDRILGLDGCSQSTVYMVAVCKRIDDPPPAEGHPPRMMSE